MRKAEVGAMIHYGWTFNYTNFIGVFAMYTRKVDVVIAGQMKTERYYHVLYLL